MECSITANGMGINEGCSSKSIVSCEDRNKLNRTAYGGSSQATFVLYLVISLVADMVIIRRRDAKRWKNDYLVKGVSLPPLACNGTIICVRLDVTPPKIV